MTGIRLSGAVGPGVQPMDRYGMVFAGSMFRPIDPVDLMRKVLPNVKDLSVAE